MKLQLVSTYKPRLINRLFIIVTALLITPLFALMFRDATIREEGLLLLIGLVLSINILVIWHNVIFITQSHLALYREGIELKFGSSSTYAAWHQTSRLGIKGARLSQIGIFLHGKVKPKKTARFYSSSTDFIPIGNYINIPLTWDIMSSTKIDTDKLRETDFGQHLYQLAPHLFDEKPKRKNQLEDRYDTQQYPDWLRELNQKEKHYD